jgi:hypothetical protein
MQNHIGPIRALLKVLKLSVGAGAVSGCGFVLVQGPPSGHEQMTSFSCTESNAGPILDVVWASLNLAGALVVAGDPESYENSDAAVAGGLIWGLVSGSAAAVGFSKTSKCREAKQQMYARMASPTRPPLADTVVQGVTIIPAEVTLRIGERLQLTATALNSAGVAVPSKFFRWSSSNDAVAAVSNAGLVTANAAGQVVIAANTDNVVGTASILVLDGR